MIGNLPLYGLMSLILVCAAAIICSFLTLACLLIHYGLRAEREAWPAASAGFRVFLSAGTLVILNLVAVAGWFIYVQPASDELREWFDSVVIYTWTPVVVVIFLLVYFGLRILTPTMLESSVGRFSLIAWAGISGTLSILVAVPCCLLLVLSLFTP